MISERKTIIHVIDNLVRGGAEIMLVGLLKQLNSAYSIILVTLNGLSEFSEEEIICDVKYSLGFTSVKDLPLAVLKLRKIIKQHKPSLVRSQLYWSTIISRMACPKKTHLIFSIHSQLSLDAFAHNRLSLYLEKITYNKRQAIISVSKVALHDYEKSITVSGKKFILNNCILDKFFQHQYNFGEQLFAPVKLVAVGNLSEAKNYAFLLQVIKRLKIYIPVTLDIIGEGHLRVQLQDIINMHNLPVRLLGKKTNVDELLSAYNAFVMCSAHEGFGNAPVEAMAIGLPLILNDLEVMKEMSKGNAMFYQSGNIEALAQIIINFKNNREQFQLLSNHGKEIAKEYYSKEAYFVQLHKIYENIIQGES